MENGNVEYVDRSVSVPEAPARLMVEVANDELLKPWVLVSRVEEECGIDDARLDVLKPLVLRGVLTPTADGDIRVSNEDKLERLVS